MKIWLVNKGMNWEGHTTVAVCLRQSSALKVLKSFKGFEEPREVGAGGAVCAQGTEFGSEYIEIVPMELKL